jgi:hypothetical protein
MQLPGGVWDGRTRRREFAFAPVTGEFEMVLLEQSGPAAEASIPSLPRRVTAVLCGALAHVGNATPTAELINGLAIGDRQFLMRRLALALGSDATWLASTCEKCHQPFDVQVDQSLLPVKEAGHSFPFATAETSLGHCRLRVPAGADQEAAAEIPDDDEAIWLLARRCIVEPIADGEQALGEDDITRIDAALEAVAPEVATIAESRCPDCGHANHVYVDPYACLTTGADALWDEIHELASVYHWSERDILVLSRERRQRYLGRIARTGGFARERASAG